MKQWYKNRKSDHFYLKAKKNSIISRAFYKLEEIKRLLEAKTIRFLPLSIKDKILEKKYKNIMENNDEISSIYPGSPEAAIGEKTTL